MSESVSAIITTFKQVFPILPFLVLILASLIFLLLTTKNRAGKAGKLLTVFSLCMLVLFFLPPVYKTAGKFMRNGAVYWRFLWIFPYALIIAYAAVRLLSFFSRTFLKIVFGVIIACVIIFTGRTVYNSEIFQKAENPEKVPGIVIESVSVLHQNAQTTGNDYIKVMAPYDVLNKIRQYDATVQNASVRFISVPANDPNQPWDDFIRIFQGAQPYDASIVLPCTAALKADYMVLPDSYNAAPGMQGAGWTQLYERNGWQIWYNPDIHA